MPWVYFFLCKKIQVNWNELPDSVVNAPNVNTFKNNYEAPIPGHHLAEDRAKRFEHVDLSIEANACGHKGS